MNASTRIASVALAGLLLSATAWADHDNRGNGRAQYDYARVLSAEPIVNYVTVTTPVQECWEEMHYYTVDRDSHRRSGGALVGAVLGGVIGHQFGSGRGNDAATVAGTLIGAAIGGNSAGRDGNVEQHARPVKRCETRYREHREERIDGYRVVYSYRGQRYMTEMPYDPGNKLRVRVDVRPAA